MSVNILYQQNQFYQKYIKTSLISSELYYIGNLPTDEQKTVGIIGTRKPTQYGISSTMFLTEGLVGYQIHVISGLAIGIDSLAHRQALANNIPTSAIVPSDLHNIYPSHHSKLADHIVRDGGAVISQFSDLKHPRPNHFYERNYLLAAICDVLVVIEAAKRSGTMITVGYALELGKPVLALPGRVGDPMSYGTNHLIAQGATPLLSPSDVVEVLKLKPRQESLFFKEEHRPIFEALDQGISEINLVQQASGFEIRSFNGALTELELDGLIKIEAGHIYKRGLA